MSFKVIKGRVVTGGRTIPEIREANSGQGMTYRDFENMQKAYDHLNGAEAIFRLWASDGFESYYLAGWEKEYDEQIMMGMYYAEQTNPFQDEYKNNLEGFIADWKANKYDPMCAFALSPGDVETIEVLKEAGGEQT
ncbi:hypothetical protein [Paenibacillus elgii]|uniref:hypothetical protein n=1 Tax=Paenibacillus elgii TaxID=189691 RepID=UPI000248C5F7|nr:hypothetical protein [Paenibacillus elgii]